MGGFVESEIANMFENRNGIAAGDK